MKPGTYFWSIRLYLEPENPSSTVLTADGIMEVTRDMVTWRHVRQELAFILFETGVQDIDPRGLQVLAFNRLD